MTDVSYKRWEGDDWHQASVTDLVLAAELPNQVLARLIDALIAKGVIEAADLAVVFGLEEVQGV